MPTPPSANRHVASLLIGSTLALALACTSAVVVHVVRRRRIHALYDSLTVCEQGLQHKVDPWGNPLECGRPRDGGRRPGDYWTPEQLKRIFHRRPNREEHLDRIFESP
jgi:hypothetical protein